MQPEDGDDPEIIDLELGERNENGLYLYELLGETFERELLAYGESIITSFSFKAALTSSSPLRCSG